MRRGVTAGCLRGVLAFGLGCLAAPAGVRAQAAGPVSGDTDGRLAAYVVGVAENFGAAMYVFDGPDRDNNLANCGTARGAALNAGLYLDCVALSRVAANVRVGDRKSWVTVFEDTGDPVLTFVLPDRSRKENMEACEAVLEVPTHQGWTCQAGGARPLAKARSGS